MALTTRATPEARALGQRQRMRKRRFTAVQAAGPSLWRRRCNARGRAGLSAPAGWARCGHVADLIGLDQRPDTGLHRIAGEAAHAELCRAPLADPGRRLDLVDGGG